MDYRRLDAMIRGPLPTWVSPIGLAIHVAVGGLATLVGIPVSVMIGFAIGHEIGDGDLKRPADGWPWNGLLDILAFLVIPLT